MRLISVDKDEFQYRCDCGTEFWASPALQDNCFWDDYYRSLAPQCPSCKRCMDRQFVPGPQRIFVFGSNLAGIHGAGAAKAAHLFCGAQLGNGVGLQGSSYAIPTKDEKIATLPLKDIFRYIDDFLQFATRTPGLRYFVTRIGCGLAGYGDRDIAPRFKGAPENCELPFGWRSKEFCGE